MPSDLPNVDIQKEQKKARRNEIVQCRSCGVALPRKKLKRHKLTACSSKLERGFERPPREAVKNVLGIDGSIAFVLNPKRLERVPLEYQASVYAKMQREKREQENIKRRSQIDALKAKIRGLKNDLKNACGESVRVQLTEKIKKFECEMKKMPKPKRKYSSVLPGSFESGRRR
jgi:hypothetical protein